MRRRDFIISVLGGAAAWPHGAHAQSKLPRLCFVTIEPGTAESNRFGPFFQSLRDLGYVNGQTITIDYLSADGQGDRFPGLSAECLRLNPDIIVVTTTPAAESAKRATDTIPIVMYGLGDPVGTGLVENLAHPGGNVTGVSNYATGLAAKRLELLKEVVPSISRVLVASYGIDPVTDPQLKELAGAAATLGVKLLVHDIRTADDLPTAFGAGIRDGAEGLVATAASKFIAERERIVGLAAQHRLPGMYPYRQIVDAGGLMSYAPTGLVVRIASYVDKVLKGTKPADLPVEQPTMFELVINLKTAKALGITVPHSIITRADEVIE